MFPAPTAVAHQNLFFHFAHTLYSLEPSTNGNIQGVFFSVIHPLFSKASVVVEIVLMEPIVVVLDVNLMVEVIVLDSVVVVVVIVVVVVVFVVVVVVAGEKMN